jgi:hypothetical protein
MEKGILFNSSIPASVASERNRGSAIHFTTMMIGVRLDVKPILQENREARLELAAEVAELDHDNAVLNNGAPIPVLTTRRVSSVLKTGLATSMILTSLRRVPQLKIAEGRKEPAHEAPDELAVIVSLEQLVSVRPE